MPKSKNRKNHNKKVSARNKRIKQQKESLRKMQDRILSDLIKQEQEKGSFDDTKSIDYIDGPTIGEVTEGPQI